MLRLQVVTEKLVLKTPFAISGYVFDFMPAVVVTLSDGAYVGRGEASGVYYFGEDADRMLAQVESVRGAVEAGISRSALQALLPAGGARNALDCALWELQAAREGIAVWQLAGLSQVHPLVTTMTAGADAPEKMARIAADFTGARAIKLKLTGDVALDTARVAAVRQACPAAWLGVDANQGYDLARLDAAMPAFVRNGVALVEQPLPRGQDHLLEGFGSPIKLAADESLQVLNDVAGLRGRFDVANIKLDKSGGLTEALAMVERARSIGLAVMVGNMAGSSWAMAPAFIVGQSCEIVDLDGPLVLGHDRDPAVRYIDGQIHCDDDVWGRGLPA
jgi:L-alanine-DL-glutamate epimerase-like enolase superfamily enzyme